MAEGEGELVGRPARGGGGSGGGGTRTTR
ncbi:MAG: hypothetical protein JWM18_2318, partial [Chloroflexi bacterium]|nr:hypothetical protein [Chloroflexota bacterium]